MLLQKIEYHFSYNADKVAIYSKSGAMTYAQLATHCYSIAKSINQRLAEPDSLIAILMNRQPAIIATLLGIMRAGHAYTIVETGNNHQETMARLHAIQPDFIITDEDNETFAQESGFRWVTYHAASSDRHDSELPSMPDGHAVAYVLYTSGSTGAPKGVEVSHDNLTHYCRSLTEQLNLAPHLIYGHVSTLAADLGNTCLFLSLWSGGSLYLANESERKDPAALARLISDKNIQVLKITPTHWRPVLTALQAQKYNEPLLECLLLGGEALQTELARASLEHLTTQRLVNHYGPTETTIGVTIHQTSLQELRSTSELTLPIGQPFGCTQILLRENDGKFSDKGSTEGELFIGGPSVAKGYRNLPQASAERFIELSDYAGLYYRTGDRVRRETNGTLHFLGRVDRQVKIKGYRVELEAVEREIRNLTDVDHAVTFCHRYNNHDYLLCAYSGIANNIEEMRHTLSERVPSYMIPARFEYLDSMPMTPNGKVDLSSIKRILIENFEQRQSKESIGPVGNPTDKCEQDVIRAFKKQLQGVTFTINDDFFQLGGDSLDAIQLVSDLQLQGYPLTAHSFLSQPSVQGVLESLRISNNHKIAQHKKFGEVTSCSPSQQWFFRQNMQEPNRWTQALSLEVGIKLDHHKLNIAFMQLATEHPMLTARFFCNDLQEWQFIAGQISQKIFIHDHTSARSWSERESVVREAYQMLESQLDLHTGQLCRATLLDFCDGPSILLLIAHHLAVDIITWRLLLDDLMRHYAVETGLETSTKSFNLNQFDDWCRHLEAERHLFVNDIHYWQSQPQMERTELNPGQEKDSKTLWLALTEQESRHINQVAAEKWNCTLDRYLLAAFLEEAAQLKAKSVINVDVESHGRLSLRSDIDVSRTAGWFTSIFPLTFDITKETDDVLVSIVNDRMNTLPHLGTAHGLLPIENTVPAALCFNYAGQFKLGIRNDWQLTPADVVLPSLRGTTNNRIHELKLTGRMYKQQLLLDINFNSQQYNDEQMLAWAQRLHARLLRHIPLSYKKKSVAILDSNNSAGAIWNPLPALLTRTKQEKQRQYKHILLTGATGFIGIHVLQKLLEHTDACIHCLIRPRSETTAEQRLQEAWQTFFELETLQHHKDRVQCLSADLVQPNLGLTHLVWESLGQTIDAIYHFAADTKLVGSGNIAHDNILAPVKGCIHLAETGKPKDLHFMSTLAVSGTRKGKQPRYFDETSLEIDQEFQNSYERYKYDAEILVRNFAYRGSETFIYRTGNVTGHSQSGKFQRNAADNRLVQSLKGIVALGQIPLSYDEKIVLSPVDIVAHGLVALSLDTSLNGGTFHLDSEYTLPIQTFINVLERYGAQIEKVNSPSLEHLFRQSGRLDHKDIAIGYFWSARGDRNIQFNHRKTLTHLERHGIIFKPLDHAWAEKFINHLLDQHVIQPSLINSTIKNVTVCHSETLGAL
ncbi:AMP-binding protein [Xenorhabdus hominickii]|uniref:Pyoverdine chromophore synthetase n=1 Tax=Xenorhabdus hominickii TaxID=351679 RepID=A0A2G0Q2W6_XENHO|nr:AMP-binding protein [Xenorhabdus hominickii]AOM39783.1 hypothetical protein A9255_03840 [Xenorhabdus hominickii]PHM53560.1 pyoverdine chromophore precursor synthetase [Xenorhabdus hominickii]